MSKNGQSKDYHQQLTYEYHARTTNPAARPGLHTFLARWRRHPRRIFWHLDPITGQWKQL